LRAWPLTRMDGAGSGPGDMAPSGIL